MICNSRVIWTIGILLVAVAAGCTTGATELSGSPGAPSTSAPGTEDTREPGSTDEGQPLSSPAVDPGSVTPAPTQTPMSGLPEPAPVATPGHTVGPVATAANKPAATPTRVVETRRTPEPVADHESQAFYDSMFGPITCDASVGAVELTESIYDPRMYDSLVPMGRMWDSHVTPTDHLYLRVNDERERGYVHTPAEGSVIEIARFPNDQAPHWDTTVVEPDYRVIIAHSCEVFSIFIHLGELAPELAKITGEIAPGEAWFGHTDDAIRLDAGDRLALFGGSSIDYSLHDESITLAGFQVPVHYEREPWKVHTVDPFDYMSEGIAAEMGLKNERTAAPLGGRIDYDVPGTVAGNWFMDGTIDYSGGGSADGRYWTGHLSIAYDHINPSQVRISIGRDIGITYSDCRVCGGVYAVAGNGPDPATVTAATGPVSYVLTGRTHSSPSSTEGTVSDGNALGTFLVEVVDDLTIRTEFVPGPPGEVLGFSSDSVIYRR